MRYVTRFDKGIVSRSLSYYESSLAQDLQVKALDALNRPESVFQHFGLDLAREARWREIIERDEQRSPGRRDFFDKLN